MSLLVILIILALVAGGLGLLVEGLKWLLIIAAILFIAGIFTGFRGRSRV
ncbi:MAG TPA: hypothetical protein VM638_09010 [Actinomycetota bacterium]|nr:hypothetical protein [Actinomycetota bacterium]